ncbi:UNVERIFIED_CONTAM: protein indeterminate-domain 12 [Sesamum calycinum]|uniref:Protein indeterminate-domain 12 n=1 Tax=Sesamum calycinum TaxID=2727403 RepID=A0AAW2JMW8_9LAMI
MLKRYAVQSDWKAHSKICGTREYRCDCGTLFSRETDKKALRHDDYTVLVFGEKHNDAGGPGPPINPLFTSSPIRLQHPVQENPNPNNISISTTTLSSSSSSLMSATALLQKAAQMGVTMSTKMPSQSSDDQSILIRPHHHVGAPGFCATSSTTTAGLPSREEMGTAAFCAWLGIIRQQDC